MPGALICPTSNATHRSNGIMLKKDVDQRLRFDGVRFHP